MSDLRADLRAFKKQLEEFSELMHDVVDADDWGPSDTAEATEELFGDFLTILEADERRP